MPSASAQPLPVVASSTWNFDPPPDEFRADSLLDLRSLNESVAGETGFIGVDSNGDFVRGDGKPIRFWAVNSDVARSPFEATPRGPKVAPDLARHARFLAKRGVNMVRLHRQLSPSLEAQPNAAFSDINEAERDSIWRTVAAMRKQGIYTTISPYWSVPMKFAAKWNLAGGEKQSAVGLLFFDPQLQAAYKAWLRKLLAERNPYTGLALANDPSVAIIQIQNEDSLLFWSVDGIAGAQRNALESRYASFLEQKYGTLDAAVLAWHGQRAEGDAPRAGRLALLPIRELLQGSSGDGLRAFVRDAFERAMELLRPGGGDARQRRTDQTEFLARTMFDFNRMIVSFIRDELGAKQLINAGNWKTASSVRLNDAERWSYTAAQVDAVNVYTNGVHDGPNNGWAVSEGDKFSNASVLFDARAMPVDVKQTVGRPMLVTEGGWVAPNAYSAEGPFLVAAYSSLSGVGGYYWFVTGDEAWTPPQSANGYSPAQQKWMFGTPEILGSFPAAALAYRRGDLRRGEPVSVERRTLADLWQRKPAVIAEEPSFDPNRDATMPVRAGEKGGDKSAVPPEAFLVGPVQVAFEASTSTARNSDLKGLLEPGSVRANTGQIVLDETLGYCEVDAPLVQGVTAFFERSPTHRLTDVSFASGNRYGAAMAVSLDGLPLHDSRKVLVQYATQSRPTGWREAPTQIMHSGQPPIAGFEVKAVGTAPWQVVRARLDVSVRNVGLTTATVLDMNGMAVKTIPLKRSATQVEFSFPDSAMYVVLR